MDQLTSVDNLETLLIMSMAPAAYEERYFKVGEVRPDGKSVDAVDFGSVLRIGERNPSRSYTFDVSGDRLFTSDINLLLNHPAEIIGSGVEVIFYFKDEMKWCRYEPIQRPRGFAAFGKVDRWIAVHYRTQTIDGKQDYIKDVIALSKSGKALPTRVEGWNVKGDDSIKKKEELMVMALSVVEDAHRPGVLLATASAETSIVFPVNYGAHKDFLALRDGPNNTPTGRKNPILHFCKKHIRKAKSGAESEIEKHWRGLEEVSIGGMHLSLSRGSVQ